VTLPNGDVIDYLVDGLGRRVGKKLNGTLVKQWLYRDALKPVAELDGSGALVKQFAYGSHPLVPEYVKTSSGLYRVFADQLGTPLQVVNVSTGVVEQQMRHSAFGEVLEDTNPGFTPSGFARGLYAESGDSLHPDLGHGDPIGPHWDWNQKKGKKRYRIFPDGRCEPK
jgi:hypothetical protein